MKVDLIVSNIGQLVTCAPSKPKRGTAMSDVGLVENAGVAVKDGKVLDVGPSAEIEMAYNSDQQINAEGKAVCPGFVDPHTHIVFGGDRLNEFELKRSEEHTS